MQDLCASESELIKEYILAGGLLLLQEPFCISDRVIIEDYEGTARANHHSYYAKKALTRES